MYHNIILKALSSQPSPRCVVLSVCECIRDRTGRRRESNVKLKNGWRDRSKIDQRDWAGRRGRTVGREGGREDVIQSCVCESVCGLQRSTWAPQLKPHFFCQIWLRTHSCDSSCSSLSFTLPPSFTSNQPDWHDMNLYHIVGGGEEINSETRGGAECVRKRFRSEENYKQWPWQKNHRVCI